MTVVGAGAGAEPGRAWTPPCSCPAPWCSTRLPARSRWTTTDAGGTTSPGPTGAIPVGRYPASGYGLRDMAGNVREWTADHYTAPPGRERGHLHLPPRLPLRRAEGLKRPARAYGDAWLTVGSAAPSTWPRTRA
ncbi:SUMF1/EgtB/PvdO family nonheme iron enzyme [Streptomyces sp. NPDC093249]|uniref:SUMF1/EgtB/PvdO family nonheme iron enzyme n=1 Tax=unclassified Streptomyces TaxID=2593676 RepID=UPI0037F65103